MKKDAEKHVDLAGLRGATEAVRILQEIKDGDHMRIFSVKGSILPKLYVDRSGMNKFISIGIPTSRDTNKPRTYKFGEYQFLVNTDWLVKRLAPLISEEELAKLCPKELEVPLQSQRSTPAKRSR